MRTRAILAVAAVVVLAVGGAFYPISYMAAPEWDVWVVDELGKPLEGMTVRLSYRNYSAETQNHERDSTTDSHGHVKFPIQRSTVSPISYIAHTMLSSTASIHASFGRHARIFAFGGNGLEGDAIDGGVLLDWTGETARIESRIVAARRSILSR